MAKNKDGENMLNRIKDFDKLVNYIKKLIDCDKSYEIPDFIIEDLCKSLGFHISIATIENNVEEQNIIYEDKIVDFAFLHKYMQKQRDILIKSLNINSDKYKLKIEQFRYIYTEAIKMIHEEYEEKYFSNPLMAEKHTQLNKIAWDSLVRYVKYKVLKYNVEQKLSNSIISKLKELSYGRIMGNKNHNANCYYSYDDILLGFKYSYFEIEKAIMYKSFDSDLQKIKYICAIVKNNINDAMGKLENSKKSEEKILNTDFSYMFTPQADYVRKTEECLPDLDDLW